MSAATALLLTVADSDGRPLLRKSSELYVTPSRFFPGPTSKANDGKLFRVTGTGAKGLPSHAFDG